MLTKQDLLDIRGIVADEVREGIKTQVPPIVRAIVREEIDSLMEHQILPQFDFMHREFAKIHREIAWIKNAMVTKSFLEERLERFRLDLGLSYRAAN